MKDVLQWIGDPEVNRPLEEPLLPHGVFSFLYKYKGFDLRNEDQLVTGIQELCAYLSVSTGEHGFRLLDKLKALSRVYGVIPGIGIFPVLEVEELGDGNLVLKSLYFKRLLNEMCAEAVRQGYEKMFADLALTNLITARNKVAAQIVAELIVLLATSGQKRKPWIALHTLASRVPELREILWGSKPCGVRNKRLRRAFEGVEKIMEKRTRLVQVYDNLEIRFPLLEASNPDTVIRLYHNGFHRKEKGGMAEDVEFVDEPERGMDD
ncbi:hypothetical protein LJK88_04470 [Paenibacillus sp. P26]|nr:hypothetical protein LJK88_04470 [Paenibacillus sp. P26]